MGAPVLVDQDAFRITVELCTGVPRLDCDVFLYFWYLFHCCSSHVLTVSQDVPGL